MSRIPLPLAAAAALTAAPALADVPRVAVDIAPVHSLVARVMEGVGAPDLIVAPGASPHEYNLRPSEAAALQEADIVVWMGADLTPWLDGAIDTLAGEADTITLLEADGITRLPTREGALFEAHSHGDGHGHDDHATEAAHDHDHDAEHADGDDHSHDEEHDHGEDHAHGEEHDHGEEHAHGDEHDHGEDHAHGEEHDHGNDHAHDEGHAHGDDHAHDEEHADGGHGHAHGAHDPHAWLSPDNAALWLNAIAAALSEADPENAGAYFANAAAGRDELAALSAEIEEMLAPVRGQGFIVFHDAYQYFEASFDLPTAGAISLSDASDPSPARIAEIQERVADQGVSCVLSEPQFDPGIVAAVMEGTEAQTAVLDPLGSDLAPGPALYPEMLRGLATALAGCLSGS